MSRFLRSNKDWINQPPGMIDGKDLTESLIKKVHLISYDADSFEESKDVDLPAILDSLSPARVDWININTITNADLLKQVESHFKIHPLTVEDITHPRQRSKCENMEHYLYIVIKMIYYDETKRLVNAEQFSLLLFDGCVITFQERPGDVFEAVRKRLRENIGRIRKMKADYLAYSLLDAIIDQYFVIIEKISDSIEELEEELLDPDPNVIMKSIHDMKREILLLRKFIWPTREMVSFLQKDESDLVTKDCQPYVHDLYDHIIQIIDTVETLRDVLSGLMDMYLTQIGNRMNEIMKVLTIMASLFIPLTFIAGIYGMNFEFMPELKLRWGYPAALCCMAVIAAGMLLFFRRKRWL